MVFHYLRGLVDELLGLLVEGQGELEEVLDVLRDDERDLQLGDLGSQVGVVGQFGVFRARDL